MLIGMRRSPGTRAAGAMSVGTMMQARTRQSETPSKTSRTSRPVVRRRSFFTGVVSRNSSRTSTISTARSADGLPVASMIGTLVPQPTSAPANTMAMVIFQRSRRAENSVMSMVIDRMTTTASFMPTWPSGRDVAAPATVCTEARPSRF